MAERWASSQHNRAFDPSGKRLVFQGRGHLYTSGLVTSRLVGLAGLLGRSLGHFFWGLSAFSGPGEATRQLVFFSPSQKPE